MLDTRYKLGTTEARAQDQTATARVAGACRDAPSLTRRLADCGYTACSAGLREIAQPGR